MVIQHSPLAVYRQTRFQRDRCLVAIQGHLRGVNAVRHRPDSILHRAGRGLQDVCRQAVQILEAEFQHHAVEPPDARIVAGNERADVSNHLNGVATVAGDDRQEFVVDKILRTNPHVGNQNTLFINGVRIGGKPATSHIGDMAG